MVGTKEKPGTISKILDGEENVNNVILENLYASDIVCMKYTPINITGFK